MEQTMSDQAVARHLHTLSAEQVSNLKSHANAADSETHSSFQILKNWVAAIGLGTATGATMWKIIKVIRDH
jgi:predicted phosphoribosyltransferase